MILIVLWKVQYIDIINLMFEKGADDFYNFISHAASVENIELIKLLIKKIEE